MYSPASYFCDRLVAPLDLADERRRSTWGTSRWLMSGLFVGRHLPHVEVDGKGYFVTGVLQDAMQARESFLQFAISKGDSMAAKAS